MQTELAWLLAQEARSAARKLRQGVGIPPSGEDVHVTHVEEGSGGVESTLNRLDEAELRRMLQVLIGQSGPPSSSKGGPDKTREALSEAVFDLARGVRSLGERLDYEDPGLQAETRTYALRAAERATRVLEDKEALATSVVVGQVRLTASDLLRGSGMDLAAAQQALDDAAGGSHGL